MCCPAWSCGEALICYNLVVTRRILAFSCISGSDTTEVASSSMRKRVISPENFIQQGVAETVKVFAVFSILLF
jgi:hypothetical protein